MTAPSPTPADRHLDMVALVCGVIIGACLLVLAIAALTNPVVAGLLWLPVEWVREFWWLVVGPVGVWWWVA